MKVVIEQGEIKREITGPFRMCISRDNARSLVRCIGPMAESGCYGWIDIVDVPVVSSIEGPPLPWDTP